MFWGLMSQHYHMFYKYNISASWNSFFSMLYFWERSPMWSHYLLEIGAKFPSGYNVLSKDLKIMDNVIVNTLKKTECHDWNIFDHMVCSVRADSKLSNDTTFAYGII